MIRPALYTALCGDPIRSLIRAARRAAACIRFWAGEARAIAAHLYRRTTGDNQP